MMPLVFVHGWGYDPRVWDAMAPHFSGHDIKRVDLGFTTDYTGDATDKIPDGSVVIGHSLGVMWALKNSKNIKSLVSIAGFDAFEKHQSRALKSMQAAIHADKEAAASTFRKTLCADDAPVPRYNWKRMKDALAWLSDWDASQELKKLQCPVLALAAPDDKVVPKKMSQTIWENSTMHWSDGGGHVLPLTRAIWCAQTIKEFMNNNDIR